MNDSRPDLGTTRRELLGGLLGGLGLAAVAPFDPAARAAQISAGPLSRTWSLRATPTSYTFPTGTALPFYRLQHAGPGPTHGLIPILAAREGQSVILRIENQLPTSIRPALIDVIDGPRIRPGRTGRFAFAMPPAGSYLIGPAEARRPGAGPTIAIQPQRPLSGFSALMISRPSSGANELWTGGPTYDREYFLLYEDADDRWNAAMTNPNGLPTAPYEPNYFLLNGLAYPDIASDPASVVAGNLGERILIRMGNLGRMRQSLHFHGFHPEVVARNNVPETILGEKDTLPLPSRTTADVILTAGQPGSYPLHPHSLTAVTANGFYPNGQLTLIVIT